MIITGIGPLAITGRPSASPGAPVGIHRGDGSVFYDWRTTKTFTDITWNGMSVKNYGVIEVCIKDGYGYIETTINPLDDATYAMPDGTMLTYVNYGAITIT